MRLDSRVMVGAECQPVPSVFGLVGWDALVAEVAVGRES